MTPTDFTRLRELVRKGYRSRTRRSWFFWREKARGPFFDLTKLERWAWLQGRKQRGR